MADTPAAGGLSRRQLEAIEEARLHSCALRSSTARRRHQVDAEGRTFDLRTEFQRDRDRIVHARAFRRLRHKTQVYLATDDDHARNRLIHSLEVAGMARTLARALGLNEDLAEGIALGHDLGHCAFGMPGERVLHGILTGQVAIAGLDRDAACVGGFKHNHQSLRVVDLLEKRYRHPGLNLTDPVREGILKSAAVGRGIEFPDVEPEGLHLEAPPFLEAQVVALADSIATQVHDLDDGLHGGVITLDEVHNLEIVRHLAARMGAALERGRFLRINQLNRGLVHLLITSAATHSAAALDAWAAAAGISSHDTFIQRRHELPAALINLPPAVLVMHDQLTGMVTRRVINSYQVKRSDERAQRDLKALFTTFYRNPLLLEDHVLIRFKEQAGGRYLRDCPPSLAEREIQERYWNNPVFVRLLADHLAAMTDSWAQQEYQRLKA
jgi:dGTPase